MAQFKVVSPTPWLQPCCPFRVQPITGSIADIAASIFGMFYLGFLPSHWLALRNLSLQQLAPGTAAWWLYLRHDCGHHLR